MRPDCECNTNQAEQIVGKYNTICVYSGLTERKLSYTIIITIIIMDGWAGYRL